jgi:hypothetical protein
MSLKLRNNCWLSYTQFQNASSSSASSSSRNSGCCINSEKDYLQVATTTNNKGKHISLSTQSGNFWIYPYNWGCTYAKVIIVLAEGLDTFRPGPTAGGRMIPPDNMSFAKRILVAWMTETWSQKGCDHFGWSSQQCVRGIILDESVHDWE